MPSIGREKYWRPARGVENASLAGSRFLFAYTFVFATLILRTCLITSFTRCAAFVGFVTGHPERRLFLWRSFEFAEHVLWYNSLANWFMNVWAIFKVVGFSRTCHTQSYISLHITNILS